jgi:RNA-directed DNA polymerase
MADRQPNNQLQLAFDWSPTGEAREQTSEGTESAVTEHSTESPPDTEHLLEEVCDPANLKQALKQVQANQGSPGVDGMTVKQLPSYLKRQWPVHRQALLEGTYQPQPVRRVRIPKPSGGTRCLGIPTVLDRFIQQAVLIVLQRRWDKTFSEHSFGFRPSRNAHQAVAQAQSYIAEGYGWVVDIDLERFFDRVNHDLLMGRIAKRVRDKRLLRLIRAYLNAGVMENGLVSSTEEGTPQGGPLSPLLSNLMLDGLDRELERRGHRFVRYADDCNIYVRSLRAGERVMLGITGFIERRLKLKVNKAKSAVARAGRRKFLGFSFTLGSRPKRRIASEAIRRLKERVRELTWRSGGISMNQRIRRLGQYLTGWRAYFGYCETPSVLADLDKWVRRRLRSVHWKQWRSSRNRYRELRRRGVDGLLAAQTVGSACRCWRISKSPALSYALPNAYFSELGLPQLCPVAS